MTPFVILLKKHLAFTRACACSRAHEALAAALRSYERGARHGARNVVTTHSTVCRRAIHGGIGTAHLCTYERQEHS